VGQRFHLGAFRLNVIECLNEARAVLFGLSFGDQGQFFRRAAIMASGGFPPLPLMEDVELSLRLRAAGPTIYLGGGLICSGRRWRREKWLKRCATVIAMTTMYLLQRRKGSQVAEVLYQRYYKVQSERSSGLSKTLQRSL
jgi:GT2 family glycosyltransferase